MRTLFNMSREEGDIPMDHYPFGKRKYQIPASTNNKRPLDGEQMKSFASYACKRISGKGKRLLVSKLSLQWHQYARYCGNEVRL
jgi:hypothetical protein